MNLLQYSYFVYLTYLLGLLNIVLPWIVDPSPNISSKLSFLLIGVVTIVISLLSKNKKYPNIRLINVKLVALVVFVLSIIQTFTPYLLSFTDKPNLVWTALLIPAFNLLAIFFTKFEEMDN